VAGGSADDLVARRRDRELAAHGVELRGPHLAALGGGLAAPDRLRSIAEGEGDGEHDGERQDVALVLDVEAEIRLDEEEIERGDAERRREERRGIPELHRHHDDAEQIQHRDVGQAPPRADGENGSLGRDRDDASDEAVRPPQERALRRWGRRRHDHSPRSVGRH